ncbi:hypothetical protein BDF20DRAFT_896156 [Mycotypha africana]|uniref:uncharacterized protein n=1 Tax=Mycotypha africana TaxID=64632 RepID=UPI002301D8C2|nr:uncharacterized protein BDF20DRAFT_896156 [Mycotypha africana]KAI8968407.1 hypothetical protein BDF20DRAFT_896156 [Mycotypha africana]
MHDRLFVPTTIPDPMSFLLNMLPTSKPRHTHIIATWRRRRPVMCSILIELEHLQHRLDLPPQPTIYRLVVIIAVNYSTVTFSLFLFLSFLPFVS